MAAHECTASCKSAGQNISRWGSRRFVAAANGSRAIQPCSPACGRGRPTHRCGWVAAAVINLGSAQRDVGRVWQQAVWQQAAVGPTQGRTRPCGRVDRARCFCSAVCGPCALSACSGCPVGRPTCSSERPVGPHRGRPHPTLASPIVWQHIWHGGPTTNTGWGDLVARLVLRCAPWLGRALPRFVQYASACMASVRRSLRWDLALCLFYPAAVRMDRGGLGRCCPKRRLENISLSLASPSQWGARW
jgi:hypothetical protein